MYWHSIHLILVWLKYSIATRIIVNFSIFMMVKIVVNEVGKMYTNYCHSKFNSSTPVDLFKLLFKIRQTCKIGKLQVWACYHTPQNQCPKRPNRMCLHNLILLIMCLLNSLWIIYATEDRQKSKFQTQHFRTQLIIKQVLVCSFLVPTPTKTKIWIPQREDPSGQEAYISMIKLWSNRFIFLLWRQRFKRWTKYFNRFYIVYNK